MVLINLNHKQTTWSWNLNIFKTKYQCKSKDFKSGSSKQVHQVVSMEGTLKDTPEIQKKGSSLWGVFMANSKKQLERWQHYSNLPKKTAKNWWMQKIGGWSSTY